ncbi:hypothetical protein KQI61_07890 [Anaerocolumna aminovalerica]|uniref:hypothetical protein n=1 Tax=Anaerocolumna aminovalerica TaxID=1527 RepID=UPI001C0ED487|nr:hypothetical protein [Anaerocolumna aminovalerica]MBU5332117.1 hypothetical protein [Anaerocolumna aminovalerica]
MSEVVICPNCGYLAGTWEKETNIVICSVCETQMQFVNDLTIRDVGTMSLSEKEQYAENYIGHKIDINLQSKRLDYCAEKRNRIYGTSKQKTCQNCGSTELTPVRKNWSLLTGILTNKVDLICNKCGAKVK